MFLLLKLILNTITQLSDLKGNGCDNDLNH
jgi:hypothetical protein